MRGDTSVGKRKAMTEKDDFLNPGEYGKHPFNGVWYARPPVERMGVANLDSHDVTEHEDGTITVAPSILITGRGDYGWHGYLEKGVWREI